MIRSPKECISVFNRMARICLSRKHEANMRNKSDAEPLLVSRNLLRELREGWSLKFGKYTDGEIIYLSGVRLIVKDGPDA